MTALWMLPVPRILQGDHTSFPQKTPCSVQNSTGCWQMVMIIQTPIQVGTQYRLPDYSCRISNYRMSIAGAHRHTASFQSTFQYKQSNYQNSYQKNTCWQCCCSYLNPALRHSATSWYA